MNETYRTPKNYLDWRWSWNVSLLIMLQNPSSYRIDWFMYFIIALKSRISY